MLYKKKIKLTLLFILGFSLYLGILFYAKSALPFLEYFRLFNTTMLIKLFSGNYLKVSYLSCGAMFLLASFISFGAKHQYNKNVIKIFHTFNHFNLLSNFKYNNWFSYVQILSLLLIPAVYISICIPIVCLALSFYLGIWFSGEAVRLIRLSP